MIFSIKVFSKTIDKFRLLIAKSWQLTEPLQYTMEVY